MKTLIGILIGAFLVICLFFGYREYQRYQLREQIKDVVSGKTDISDFSFAPTNSGISPGDFELIDVRGRWESERLRVIGELKNNGKIAAGAEIEVIARDKNGRLVDSKSFWPGSISNIPPGGSVGIHYTITEDRSAETIEAKVLRAEVW